MTTTTITTTNGELRSALGRVFFQSAQINKAETYPTIVAADASLL